MIKLNTHQILLICTNHSKYRSAGKSLIKKKKGIMEYSFVKDYKHDLKSRASFCRLAKDTFGIDFESWFSKGFWNENYICYSMEHGGEIISNVSVNLMRLMMNEQETAAIQIGTVMTHPEHRRRGLAKSLLERVIGDFSGSYTFFFLAADKAAVPLYESCGFETARTYRYEIDLAGYRRAGKPLEPVGIEPPELLEAKRSSVPLSRNLSAIGDEHVLMFYYLHGFASHIYRPWQDTLVIYETEGDAVHIYDILSPRKIKLEELLERIAPKSAERAVCHFAPYEDIEGLSAHPDAQAGWMTRGGQFPARACFPRISQT